MNSPGKFGKFIFKPFNFRINLFHEKILKRAIKGIKLNGRIFFFAQQFYLFLSCKFSTNISLYPRITFFESKQEKKTDQKMLYSVGSGGKSNNEIFLKNEKYASLRLNFTVEKFYILFHFFFFQSCFIINIKKFFRV